MTPLEQLEVLAKMLKQNIMNEISSQTWLVKAIDEFHFRVTRKIPPCEGLDIYITVAPEHKQMSMTVAGMIETQMNSGTRPGNSSLEWNTDLSGLKSKEAEVTSGFDAVSLGADGANFSEIMSGANMKQIVTDIRNKLAQKQKEKEEKNHE